VCVCACVRVGERVRLCRAYFSVQLITICAVVKSKCAVEKCSMCSKNYRDSGQNDDFGTNYQDLCSCKSFLRLCMSVIMCIDLSL